MFNLAYDLREREEWFNIRNLKKKTAENETDVLLLLAYQGKAKKKMDSSEIAIKDFVNNAELLEYLDLIDGFEHYQEWSEDDDEVCHFITIRMDDYLTQEFTEHLVKKLKKSKMYRVCDCKLVKSKDVAGLADLKKKANAVALTNDELQNMLRPESSKSRPKAPRKNTSSEYNNGEDSLFHKRNKGNEILSVSEEEHSIKNKLEVLANWNLIKEINGEVVVKIPCKDLEISTKKQLINEISKLETDKEHDGYMKKLADLTYRDEFVKKHLHLLKQYENTDNK